MSATSGLHLPVREDWLASQREEILDPGLPIIDPHHHLWDRPESRYLFPELLRDVGSGHDIRATVYVQCRSMYRHSGPEHLKPVGEVEFANGVAAQAASGLYGACQVCAGIVGFADLSRGEAARPALEAILAAGGARLKGIRVPVVWHESPEVVSSPARPPEGLMASPAFREGVRLLRDHQLTLDIWAYHTQIPEILALADAIDDVTFVVDHCAGPIGVGPYAGQRDAVFAVWKRGIEELARRPNIFMKIGGLGMRVIGFRFHEAARAPSSFELAAAWKPYFETIVSVFGPNRCMFESNFPVDKGMFGYATFWNACKRLSADFSSDERAALFFETAARIYRLDRGELLG